MITDRYNREIDYIRISITDRCNLRCKYCMPEDVPFIPHERILRYEENLRIVKILAKLGIRKVKLTGGEPLVRRGCDSLIREIKQIEGIDMVTLTTNGVLLEEMLPQLQEAGVDAINVSLDTRNRARYLEVTGKDMYEQVERGIEAVYKSGIPLKINCVPVQGVNIDEIPDFFTWAKEKQIAVRFIEMMPIGYGDQYEAFSAEQIKEMFFARYPEAYQVKEILGNGPAVYYRAPGFAGEIGIIGAVHEKFCSTCNRIRLTSEGFFKLCLYSGAGIDLRQMLRDGSTDEEIADAIADAIQRKPKEHHFGEVQAESSVDAPASGEADTRKMSQIGG